MSYVGAHIRQICCQSLFLVRVIVIIDVNGNRAAHHIVAICYYLMVISNFGKGVVFRSRDNKAHRYWNTRIDLTAQFWNLY